jgi:hypothetical protein
VTFKIARAILVKSKYGIPINLPYFIREIPLDVGFAQPLFHPFIMLKDAQGLAVTTHSSVAIAAINRFTHEALRYGREAETVLLEGNVGDRDCALIHAYTAAYYLAQEEQVFRKWAQPHLQAAQWQLGNVTERERWTVQAIAAWAAGNIPQAIALHERIVEQYPQDLLAVQQAQYHYSYILHQYI